MIRRRHFVSGLFIAAATGALPIRARAAGPYGRFEGELLTSWGRDGRTMKLRKPYAFISASGARWGVPSGISVDGASIPRPLWSIIGGPFEGLYRDASVIHDYYCDVRKRPWRDVHRMFLDAMLARGVPDLQARVMYAGVYWGGPRWSDTVVQNNNIAAATALIGKAFSRTDSTLVLKAYDAGYGDFLARQSAPPASRDVSDELKVLWNTRPPGFLASVLPTQEDRLLLAGDASEAGASIDIALTQTRDGQRLEAIEQVDLPDDRFQALRTRIEAESLSVEQIETLIDQAPR